MMHAAAVVIVGGPVAFPYVIALSLDDVHGLAAGILVRQVVSIGCGASPAELELIRPIKLNYVFGCGPSWQPK